MEINVLGVPSSAGAHHRHVKPAWAKESNYISVYRDQLIRAGMIQPAATDGRFEFALSELREYLREHAAQLIAHAARFGPWDQAVLLRKHQWPGAPSTPHQLGGVPLCHRHHIY